MEIWLLQALTLLPNGGKCKMNCYCEKQQLGTAVTRLNQKLVGVYLELKVAMFNKK